MRIKIALDAYRGIEYLHNNYVVPSIIHRNIKSSNILLDATWTAKVPDFESSSISLETDRVYDDMVRLGTLGSFDPGYLCTSLFKAKSDVYGLGIVLEILTGKPTIFKYGKHGSTNMVNFARRAISAGEMLKILDPKGWTTGCE
ncbi:Serine/threonine-protein kinase-like protein CCR4 [Glycine soja]|nr:Serine/threonine-protein kinase-like protein CCR4 [Glycine max]